MIAPWDPYNVMYVQLGHIFHPVYNYMLTNSNMFKEFSVQWSKYSQDLLNWYAPNLPAAMRQTRTFPLMDPVHMATVVIGYLLVVALALLYNKIRYGDNKLSKAKAAPANRSSSVKALGEKIGPIFLIQILYNIAQVFLCGYVVGRVIQVFNAEGYSILCNRFNVPNTEMAKITWFFYVLKYVDLMDTAFMILRGNMRQVSFLHVFHHSSVIYIFWVNSSVGYDGEIYFVVIFNAFVHVIMYMYYLLSSLNIRSCNLIKPLVTRLQLLQFVCMIFHGMYHLAMGDVINPETQCRYPSRISAGYLLYVVFLFFLFRQFSIKTYSKPNAIKKTI